MDSDPAAPTKQANAEASLISSSHSHNLQMGSTQARNRSRRPRCITLLGSRRAPASFGLPPVWRNSQDPGGG